MRNAMICVSVMLAVFLGWPLAFGGGDSNGLEASSRAEARPVVAVAPAEKPQFVQAGATSARPESCYHRFQREVRQCSAQNGAACRLKNADNWDVCEATGFWPE